VIRFNQKQSYRIFDVSKSNNVAVGGVLYLCYERLNSEDVKHKDKSFIV